MAAENAATNAEKNLVLNADAPVFSILDNFQE
jgi:hypothetical protein